MSTYKIYLFGISLFFIKKPPFYIMVGFFYFKGYESRDAIIVSELLNYKKERKYDKKIK